MSRQRLGVLIAAAGLLGAVAAIIVVSGTDTELPRPSSARVDASAARTGVPSSTRPEVVRDCAARVEGSRLSANRRVALVAGPIIVYGLREWGRAARARPSEAFRSRAGEYAPIKTITEVTAGRVITVAVAPADQQKPALLYRWRGGRRGSASGFPRANVCSSVAARPTAAASEAQVASGRARGTTSPPGGPRQGRPSATPGELARAGPRWSSSPERRGKGLRYPAEPPTVEKIIAVMREAPTAAMAGASGP